LGQTLLKDLPVLLPDIDTQMAIAETLDKKCTAIDKLTDKINAEIALLHEYYTRLVSDVVTGKLDVRDVVVPVEVQDFEPLHEELDIEKEGENNVG
jgi:type I restriction enzyme S subunit